MFRIDREEKIQVFRETFAGRTDCYGGEGKGCVKEPITDEVIWDHLTGKQRMGIYPIFDEKMILWSAADFDDDDIEKARRFYDRYRDYGVPSYIERSKSKGHHIWLWFTEPAEARLARELMSLLLAELGPEYDKTELFPKQDDLTPDRRYGNFIYLPFFGIEAVPNGRTVFLDPDSNCQPFPSQWEFLRGIKKVSLQKLSEILSSLQREDVVDSEITRSEARTGMEATPEGENEISPGEETTTADQAAEFRYVDIGKRFIRDDGSEYHSKWHRVERAELRAAFQRLNWDDSNLFVTVLSYANQEHTEGELKCGPLYFEFDAGKEGTDLADVLELSLKLIQHLTFLHDLPEQAIRQWYSGGRSIHIEVDPICLGVKPHRHLHLIYRAIAGSLKDSLDLRALDMNIYSSRRLWRYPGSGHSSGLYKIELDASELRRSVEEIREMATSPRPKLYDDEDLEFQVNESAAAWFQAFSDEIERKPPEEYDRAIDSDDDQPGIELVMNGCEFMKFCEGNAATLSEPLWYCMISNLCRFKGGSEAIHRLSEPYDGYTFEETDRKIRHAIEGSRPITCQKIRNEGFDCPRSCEVKSPAGLAYVCDLRAVIDSIPNDIDKVELPKLLKPVLRRIAELSPEEKTAYLYHHIKDRFGLTRKDIEAYEKTVERLLTKNGDEESGKIDSATMTEAERQEAMTFLKQSDLMEQTIRDQTRIGIVGEDEVKGLLHLAYTSRKSPTPVSLELRAPSGVGKSHVALTAVLLMPQEDVITMTRITSKYLDYLKEDSLMGKIFIVMERPGAEDADYSIRMLTDDTSSGIRIGYLKKNSTTGEFEPVEKVVRGPLVYIQTTTRLDANPENESRVFNVYLDDGEKQRKAVHEAVKLSCLPHQALSEGEKEAILRKHRNAQRLLETLPVAVPYAHLIEFPADKYRSTRDLKRFLSYIKTSAFYHQYQRPRCEIDGETYIVATTADYETAYRLAKKVLINALSDLNPSSRELLEAAADIKAEKEELMKQGGEDAPKDAKFTRKELKTELDWERYRVARAIGPLEEAGYFNIEKVKNAYRYELIWDPEARENELEGVLTPDELKQKIDENLDSIDDAYLESLDINEKL